MMNLKGLTKKTLATIASLGVLASSSASAINVYDFEEALRHDNTALAMQLAQQSTNVDAHESWQPTALFSAVSWQQFDLVDYLLSRGADPTIPYNEDRMYGPTLLVRAVRQSWRPRQDRKTADRYAKMIENLLIHGANPNDGDGESTTPLHLSCRMGDIEISQLLLKYSANPNARNSKGETPLCMTLKIIILAPNLTQVIDFLSSEAHADPNIPDNDGDTPLHIAINMRRFDAVEALLNAGANPNITNNKGETAESLLRQSPHWPRFAPYILNDN